VKRAVADNADEKGQEAEEDTTVPSRFFLPFVTGFVLVFIGVLVVIAALALGGNGSASAGIVIFIGPFPIVLGAGPDAAWLILISVILAAISVVLFVVMRRKLVGRVG
jgi:uncharacterized membrane protein